MKPAERDQAAIKRLAMARRVVYVPVAAEIAAKLEQGGIEFHGTVHLVRADDRPGEGDLIFTPVQQAAAPRAAPAPPASGLVLPPGITA